MFELEFTPENPDFPAPPRYRIVLGFGAIGPNNERYVSYEAMSIAEFDWSINACIQSLEGVRKDAHSKARAWERERKRRHGG